MVRGVHASAPRRTFLSMLATYTVRLQRSSSSQVRGISSRLTGTMAVLLGSTRRGLEPSSTPVLDRACGQERSDCVSVC